MFMCLMSQGVRKGGGRVVRKEDGREERPVRWHPQWSSTNCGGFVREADRDLSVASHPWCLMEKIDCPVATVDLAEKLCFSICCDEQEKVQHWPFVHLKPPTFACKDLLILNLIASLSQSTLVTFDHNHDVPQMFFCVIFYVISSVILSICCAVKLRNEYG